MSDERAAILFGEVYAKGEEVLAEAEQGSVGGENLGVVDQRVDNMTKNDVANIGGLFRHGYS